MLLIEKFPTFPIERDHLKELIGTLEELLIPPL